MRDTKTVQKFLNRSDIKAGRKPKFHEFADYEGYAIEIRNLQNRALTPEQSEPVENSTSFTCQNFLSGSEYERECKRLAEIWGI